MRKCEFEARNILKAVLNQLVDDVDYTIISRRDSEDAVVMSLEQFNGLMETVNLLKSPANAAHLAKSIKQLSHGKAKASVAWVKRGTNVTRDEQGTEFKSRHKLHY